MNPYLLIALFLYFVSYLLGSIPFGYLLVRIFRGEDVRASGSGNIGATNVARRSPGLGVATLVLDAGKGFAAVWLARAVFGPEQGFLLATAALFAIVGHLYPVWLKFRGGKGVATAFGAFALIAPKSILCMVAIFLLVVAAFRYVSLGSVTAAAAFPPLAWGLHESSEPRQLAMFAVGVGADHLETPAQPRSTFRRHRAQARSEARMSRIAIIGAGAWGTGLAMVLTRREGTLCPAMGQRTGCLREHSATPDQRALLAGDYPSRNGRGDERFG